MVNLRWIGYHNFSFFNEKFSVSCFYDIIMARIPCLSKEYLLHIQGNKSNGIPLDEWIIFDASSSSPLVVVTKLYSCILYSIDECNKLNKIATSLVIFEDGTEDNFDKEIKKVEITFYMFIKK
jgi:hypothetical protein